MKDLENKPADQSAAALERLLAALARLERAAAGRAGGSSTDTDLLRQENADLSRRHAALRQSAGQVASRLDDAITRLNAYIGSDINSGS